MSIGSIVVAVGVLAGWASHVSWMTGAIAGSESMKPNTAICAVLIGIAALGLSFRPLTTAIRGVAIFSVVVTLLICVATAAEYVFGLRLGLDQALFSDPAGGAHPGRMGPFGVIALGLLALGLAFVARDDDAGVATGQVFATLSAVIAFFAIVGYAYDATGFYGMQLDTAMAAATAVVIFALSGALILALPDRGFMRVVCSENAAGFLVRRLFPQVVLLQVLLGWLCLEGEKYGLYDTATGVCLLVTANVFTFGVAIAVNARLLRRVETLRERSQEQLRATVIGIERQIAERTAELDKTIARLAASELRFSLAADGSEKGILDLDIVSGKLYCSPGWKAMLGYDASEPIDSPLAFAQFVHPEDRDRAQALLFEHYKGTTSSFSTEVRMRHRDGTYRWMLSRGQAVRDAAGRAIRMVGSQTDITELKELQERLRIVSVQDSLTGLYNRRHFDDRLLAAVHAAFRHERPLSVCICDVDELKGVNDKYGHETGDRVLQAFALILRTETRTEDVVARYGGDEFCVLFPEQHAVQAAVCGERIRSRFANAAFVSSQGDPFPVTASFGFADMGGMDAPEFIGAADRALYDAKTQGRNRISLGSVTGDAENQGKAV